jgi:hypothetical protein
VNNAPRVKLPILEAAESGACKLTRSDGAFYGGKVRNADLPSPQHQGSTEIIRYNPKSNVA